MLTDQSIKSRLFACIAAAAMFLTTAGHTLAGDFRCETSCDACPAAVSSCTCDCSCGKKPNCLYKAFHAFAGGMKKLFGFGKCNGGCDQLCDDACDAAMIDELTLPLPADIHHHPHHGHFMPAPLESVPIDDHDSYSELHTTEPRIRPFQGARLDASSLADPEVGVMPPPVRMSVPESELNRQLIPQVEPSSERESLFDALSDPFRDDEARTRKYRSVRPSSYDEYALRPISKKPLSRSYSTSSRRATSVR